MPGTYGGGMSPDDRTLHRSAERRPWASDAPTTPHRSGRGDRDPSRKWRGITLAHRGVDIGVIGHVTRAARPPEAVLHAFGGVSRSLEYAVPESAIVKVLPVAARAIVADDVEFEPQHLRADGRVVLAPRTPRGAIGPHEAEWRCLPQAAWIGIRVYADDGYLGVVETALSTSGRETADFLVVRVRRRLRRNRLPVVPVARVLSCAPAENVARVSGTRHELTGMSELWPSAG